MCTLGEPFLTSEANFLGSVEDSKGQKVDFSPSKGEGYFQPWTGSFQPPEAPSVSASKVTTGDVSKSSDRPVKPVGLPDVAIEMTPTTRAV